jgi:hypothetical protein
MFTNTTLYYIIAVIVYLYIAVISVLLISTAARNFIIDIINKLKAKLPPEALKTVIDNSL